MDKAKLLEIAGLSETVLRSHHLDLLRGELVDVVQEFFRTRNLKLDQVTLDHAVDALIMQLHINHA